MENAKKEKTVGNSAPTPESKGTKVMDVTVEIVSVIKYGKEELFLSAKFPNGVTATSEVPLTRDEVNLLRLSGKTSFDGEIIQGTTPDAKNRKGEVYESNWLRVDIMAMDIRVSFFLMGKAKGICRYMIGKQGGK